MAQNDTNVALIFLNTQMRGRKLQVENIFRVKFCDVVPLAPTSVLTQNKGPDTELGGGLPLGGLCNHAFCKGAQKASACLFREWGIARDLK